MAGKSWSRPARRPPPGRSPVVVTIEKDRVSQVLAAVQNVLANWESGDLAGAVNRKRTVDHTRGCRRGLAHSSASMM